jgi:hypothetical protein
MCKARTINFRDHLRVRPAAAPHFEGDRTVEGVARV